MNTRKRLRLAVILFIVVFAVGVGGFKVFGGKEWSFFDCVYMTVITVATIGYGEVHDLSGNIPARVFTVVYILLSLGTIAFAVTSITAFVVEGELKNVLGRRKMEKEIARLRDHYIVCGGDEIAGTIIHELHETQRPFVVIEASRERLDHLLAAHSFPYIQGDPAEDEILLKAGLANAKGVFLSLPTDEANLFVTVTVRSLNAGVRIVVKGTDIHVHAKMMRAGADHVISPAFIGGMRMASQMVRPSVVTFLDTMLRDKEKGLRVEEVLVAKGSPLAGRSIGESRLRERTRALLVAVRGEGADAYAFNPPETQVIREDDVLIFIASPENLAEIGSLS
jgi:voltage-gated potassium channel